MYASYFGLTETETKKALEDNGMVFSDDIVRYYDGYQIGGKSIYNPWSILTYIFKKKLAAYWVNTSTNLLVRTSILNADSEFKESFEELIMDSEIEVSVNLEASFIELETARTLWGLLINSGYLTVTKEYRSNFKRIRIPNEEVKEEFREIVAIYAQLNGDRLDEMFNALMDARMEHFLKVYQRLVYTYVSSHDIATRKQGEHAKHYESSYHMLFLGMVISMNSMYEISSNLEAGRARLTKVNASEPLVETDSHNFLANAKHEQYGSHDGRADIVMKSLEPKVRPHIVVEFKQGDDVGKLKQEALDQIFEKKYYVKLSGSVLCVGLAHSMKECELVHKKIFIDESGDIIE